MLWTMNMIIHYLFFVAIQAETALKRTRRSFENGKIVISNTSNEIVRVACELRV